MRTTFFPKLDNNLRVFVHFCILANSCLVILKEIWTDKMRTTFFPKLNNNSRVFVHFCILANSCLVILKETWVVTYPSLYWQGVLQGIEPPQRLRSRLWIFFILTNKWLVVLQNDQTFKCHSAKWPNPWSFCKMAMIIWTFCILTNILVIFQNDQFLKMTITYIYWYIYLYISAVHFSPTKHIFV